MNTAVKAEAAAKVAVVLLHMEHCCSCWGINTATCDVHLRGEWLLITPPLWQSSVAWCFQQKFREMNSFLGAPFQNKDHIAVHYSIKKMMAVHLLRLSTVCVESWEDVAPWGDAMRAVAVRGNEALSRDFFFPLEQHLSRSPSLKSLVHLSLPPAVRCFSWEEQLRCKPDT